MNDSTSFTSTIHIIDWMPTSLRRIYAAIFFVVWVAIVCANFTQAQPVQDWPRFLGPETNGTSPLTGIKTDWTSGKLPLIWQTDVGQGYSIGSVADGRFYHIDKTKDNSRLRCLDANTGKLIWEFKYESDYRDLYGYDAGPRTSPLVDSEHVYIFGVEGLLQCVDLKSGQLVWKVDTAKRFGVIQNFFGVASSPLIHEEKLIVMIGGSPKESKKLPPGQLDRVKPNGSAVVAFNKLTGDVIFQTGNDLASYASLTRVGEGSDQTVLAWCRNSLLGIAPGDGSIRFQIPWRSPKLESVNAMTPVALGNQFFISECYGPGSLLSKLVDGKVSTIWSDVGKPKPSLQAHWGTPVVFQGHLYGSSGRHSATASLRCIELATGEIKWDQPGFRRCSVVLVDGHLIVLGEHGRLALVEANPTKFKLVTERKNNQRLTLVPNCWAAPIVANGNLYVRDGKKLACFKLKQDQ